MQKLVIDTNVFISYLISKDGYSFKIIDEILLNKKALHFLSNDTVEECSEVFNRTRFVKKYPDFSKTAYLFFRNLMELSVIIQPSLPFSTIKDESDNKFLELAYAAQADYIITGNKHHFTFSLFYNTRIASPKEYWKNYQP